jgi:hypothetical protein
MFFARDDGAVWWLNTGTAELTRVADSIEHFHERLATDVAMNGSSRRSSKSCNWPARCARPVSATPT